jgi:FAD/FMN-containing dehydrogenase
MEGKVMCPPETSAGIKDALAAVVNPKHIVDDAAILEKYCRDHSFVSGHSPQLLVYPGNKEDVQGIVKLAGESKIPLAPVSSGPPRFHGDTVPNQSGIIVDFKRMKRIHKIDPVNRYVMVEPGVTYSELLPEVKKQGLKLNIPLLPRAAKSVVTSRLEREPVLIPKYQYDNTDPLLTMEVVYGTGEEFRTGSASGPGNLETLKADKVNPWGPGAVDYARFLSGAQGTMGLVTWAVTKAEILPSLQRLYFIPVADMAKLTRAMDSLLRKRVVDECLALNNVNLATMLAENWSADYEELKANLPSWTLIACVAGYRLRPEERVFIMERYLKEICADLGLKPGNELPGAEGKEKEVLNLLSGFWNKEPYWKLRHKGSCRDIFFLTALSRASGFIELLKSVVSRYRYPGDDIGCYVQPVVQGRGCHCEFNLPCDDGNAREMDEVQRLFRDASETLLKNGAFFSRPYGFWSEMVFSRYAEGVAVSRKLKGLFDPNNILNPGKLCF